MAKHNTSTGGSEQCNHEFTDWIQVGLGPKGEKRYWSRTCKKCDHREGEWRPLHVYNER